jgi:GNAT superfamily N-acetyltransferase
MPQRPLEERDAVAPRAKQPDAALAARVRFRVGGDADVPAVVPLINEAYLREAWLLPPPRTTVGDLRDELRVPGAALLIAELDGALAGCARIKRREHDTYFGLLAVAKAQQGRGLASLIVAQIEEMARVAGSDTVRLDCAKKNNLVPLYESMGYVLEREEPGAYYGAKGPITVSHLKKDLR